MKQITFNITEHFYSENCSLIEVDGIEEISLSVDMDKLSAVFEKLKAASQGLGMRLTAEVKSEDVAKASFPKEPKYHRNHGIEVSINSDGTLYVESCSKWDFEDAIEVSISMDDLKEEAQEAA